MDPDRERPTDPPRRAKDPIDEERSAPTVRKPEAGGTRSRWGRRLAWVFAALVVVLGLAAGALGLYWKEIAVAVVLAQARAHGVALEMGTLDIQHHGLTIDSVTLGDATVSMASLPGVEVKAKEVSIALSPARVPTTASLRKVQARFEAAPDVKVGVDAVSATLNGFAPESLAIQGVTIDAGDAQALLALAEVARGPHFAAISTKIHGLRLKVKKVSAGLPVELAVEVKDVSPKGPLTVLAGVTTKLPIVNLDVSLAKLELRGSEASLHVGIPSAPELSIDLNDGGREIDVILARVPADFLADKLGWSRPPDFALSARAKIRLPDEKGASVEGTYEAVLEHYVPPHPAELDGIVFGDATKASGKFQLHGDAATLTDLRVQAGALALSGEGTASLADRGKVTLTLSGSIPCSSLAASAIAAHLGLGAGFLAGQLASGHLTGSVSVRLGVVVEGKNAAHPDVHPAASLHCGLSL